MSKKIALCGMMSGLAIVFAYVAMITPTGRLGFYLFSSLPIAVIMLSYGAKTAFVAFVAVNLLLIALGAIESFILFGLFFGSYIFIKSLAEKNRSRVFEFLIKFIYFNIVLCGAYYINTLFLNMETIDIKLILMFAAVGQIAFLLYDYALSKVIFYYDDNIKKRIMR